MKIRTITTGVTFKSPEDFDKIRPLAEFNQKAKTFFEESGYEVQTTRIATNSWQEYLHAETGAGLPGKIRKVEEICLDRQVSFFNIGYASTPKTVEILPEIIRNTSVISCSGKILRVALPQFLNFLRASARAIRKISEETENGGGNFRFCAWCNCKPGIPFFPAAYHDGETSFSIGLECSDLAMRAFSNAKNLLEAEQNFRSIVEEELRKVQDMAQEVSVELNIRFRGIDASLAPSLDKDESLAFAYEKLDIGKFGQPGTLAISAMITGVLKSLSLKTCGYSGLMLPVCEDF